jgi:hypothetical protein
VGNRGKFQGTQVQHWPVRLMKTDIFQELPPLPHRVHLGTARESAPGAIDRADAPDTRRVYAADWRHFNAWCLQVGLAALPAAPASLAAYLAAHAEAHALATLRRRLADIARVHREAWHAFNARDPAIRNALRGIARAHAALRRQSPALTTVEIRALVRTCAPDLAT